MCLFAPSAPSSKCKDAQLVRTSASDGIAPCRAVVPVERVLTPVTPHSRNERHSSLKSFRRRNGGHVWARMRNALTRAARSGTIRSPRECMFSSPLHYVAEQINTSPLHLEGLLKHGLASKWLSHTTYSISHPFRYHILYLFMSP